MPTITTEIDIAASPSDVRKVFLDFASYPEWSKAFIKSIQVTAGDETNIKPGDTLKVDLGQMKFAPVVEINTPEEFRWCGSLPGIFVGAHSFRFAPSTQTPGHTTVTQQEEFSGILSFLLGPTWTFGKQTKDRFEAFNRDLQKRAEQVES